MQYVVVLTKVDKASAKTLQSTRQAVMNMYDTISEINTPVTPTSASLKDRFPAADTTTTTTTATTTAADTFNERDTKKSKKSRRENNSNITIIETSSTERIGREQLWQIILKVLNDRKKQLLLHSAEMK